MTSLPHEVIKVSGRGRFSETFMLHHYPFDVQRLAIRWISRRPQTELMFVNDPNGGSAIDANNFMQDNEWKLITRIFQSSTNLLPVIERTDPWVEKDDQSRSKVKICFCLQRGVFYHIMNTFVPMFLLTAMTGFSYVLDPEEATGDRLALTFTMILTITLFQNGVDEKSPAVAYLTFQNKYKFWCCELMTMLMLIQNAVASVHAKDRLGAKVDEQTFYAWVILFGLVHVCFTVWAVHLWKMRVAIKSTDPHVKSIE
jgi:hypothetical protein